MTKKAYIRTAMTVIVSLSLSGLVHAQTAPVSAISTEALVDALTPAPRPLTRGLSLAPRETPTPSIDLAVEFDFASSSLTPQATQLLSNLGDALQSPSLANLRFRLSGHTDAVGGDAANDRLSLARAESVRTFLVETLGVSPERLEAIGYGRQRLLFPEAPDDARNRRVEVSVISE
jgi:outer membrane protein OmpA-like peptidoglycan-associated protein